MKSRAKEFSFGKKSQSADTHPLSDGKNIFSEGYILPKLGVYGFNRYEKLILASLVTRHPILLIGNTGTGKTFLLNTLSEALGLEHRHYNASTITIDDLIGFPLPDDKMKKIIYWNTDSSIWKAESVLLDEISRARPENQNKFFSIINERKIQGIPLKSLKYCWAAMNPHRNGGDNSDGFEYFGSEPLDPALADRFALFIDSLDWGDLSEGERVRIADPSGEGKKTPINRELIDMIERAEKEYHNKLSDCPSEITGYTLAVADLLTGEGIKFSPRRTRLMASTLLAATILNGGIDEKIFCQTLESSIPHKCWGAGIAGHRTYAIHRIAWKNFRNDRNLWMYSFLRARDIAMKFRIFIDKCSNQDEGSEVICELIKNERRDTSAAFIYAIYPLALMGKLPIGTEGICEMGKVVSPFLEVKPADFKDMDWLNANYEFHPYKEVIEGLEKGSARRERAQQFFLGAFAAKIEIARPQEIEEQINEVVLLIKNKFLKG